MATLRQAVWDWALFSLALAAVAFGVRWVGDLRATFSVACATAAAVLLAILLVPRPQRAAARLLYVFAAVLLIVAFIRAPAPARPAVLGAALLLGARLPRGRGSVAGLGLGLVATSILVVVLRSFPLTWTFLGAWSDWMGAVMERMTGSHVQVGPTAAGCQIVLSAWLLFLASRRLRRWWSHLVVPVALLFLQFLYVGSTEFLVRLQDGGPGFFTGLGHTALDSAWVLCPLLGAGFAILAPRSPVPRAGRRWASWAVVMALLLVVPASQVLAGRAVPGKTQGVVWIHNAGWLDVRPPGSRGYGAASSGMFGMLQPLLSGLGFRAEMKDLRSCTSLDGVDAIVIINLQRSFAPELKTRIDRFVRGGGGLLVLGDHTGLKGIRPPFNELVGRYGIRFNFDSAIPLRRGWSDGMRFRPHPITSGVVTEADTRIWTGASLSVAWPSYPVILGQAAFSDPGDASNGSKGHLGDMRYTWDEPLGDIVLVAAAEPEEGRVLVFGDTSTFQNTALGHSRLFAQRCVDWLTGSERGKASPDVLLLVGVLGVALAFALVVLPGVSVVQGAVVAGACLVAVLLSSNWSSRLAAPGASEGRPFAGTRPVAVIDSSVRPRAARGLWGREGLGGLQLNLFRAGYLPFFGSRLGEAELAESSLLVWTAPTRDLSSETRERLRVWLEAGGCIFVAQGWPNCTVTPRILELAQVRVKPLPLGPAVCRWKGLKAKLHSGFPVEPMRGGEVVLAAHGHPVAVWTKIGRGGIFYLGDSDFFHNRNLEDDEDYVPENVALVQRLFEEYRPASHDKGER